jgi:hypothetical protein
MFLINKITKFIEKYNRDQKDANNNYVNLQILTSYVK